jgi:hypothetical protein
MPPNVEKNRGSHFGLATPHTYIGRFSSLLFRIGVTTSVNLSWGTLCLICCKTQAQTILLADYS